MTAGPRSELGQGLLRLGRYAWATVGVLLAVVAVGFALSQLSLVAVPVVLALFPATLLVPLAGWLRARMPDALAALVTILVGLVTIGAVVGAMVPFVVAEAPDLAASAREGLDELVGLVDDLPVGPDVGGVDDLADLATERFGGGEEGDDDQMVEAAVSLIELVVATLLLVVVLFFYLKDGPRLARGIVATLPAGQRDRAERLMAGAWETLGRYFRGQLLVALVDAVFIGLGLVLLGVPLALPLAVLIFFGGLFPIVGAVVTGSLAVLVALADGGLGLGLVVAGLVLLVQQLESNVLEPLILGNVIALHPLVIVLVITAGSVVWGVLGAFLAVPVAAIVARVVDDLRSAA